MHVSTEGKPYPLRLERKAGRHQDEIGLGRFDQPVPRATPPKDRTITVDQLRRHFGGHQQDEPPSESV